VVQARKIKKPRLGTAAAFGIYSATIGSACAHSPLYRHHGVIIIAKKWGGLSLHCSLSPMFVAYFKKLDYTLRKVKFLFTVVLDNFPSVMRSCRIFLKWPVKPARFDVLGLPPQPRHKACIPFPAGKLEEETYDE
jgi:hypothetical protein